jgi:hypothetical protein
MKKFTNRFILVLGLSILSSLAAKAQIGTQFWFVAPEVSEEHGDSPLIFRITAFDQDAEVTISMPANTGFPDETITVPANSQIKYEGLNDPDIIENRPGNEILNKGILITSDEDISVYYDMANTNNPDKFTLKADNALGTEFFIPSQNAFDNHNYNTHPARERIDIVATENDTQIEVEITDDIIGHNQGDIITVTLQRGQTYSMVATNEGEQAAHHLGGTHITSSHAIAVTISDDSIEKPQDPSHWDLIGDQLIPADLLGTEYISMNTLYGQGIVTDQKVFILATEDDTYLAVNGNYKATLARGELHQLDISDNAIYITSDKPICAYQVTGIPPEYSPEAPNGTELGSAILPNTTCTGSTSVSFTRVLNFRFFVQLATNESNRNSFHITGQNTQEDENPETYLDNLTWTKVPGTGTGEEEAWYSTVIQMGAPGSGLATNSPYTISNSGLFHMSILDENNVSMSYGYFSDYSSLRITGLTMQCEGDEITLETEDPMRSYQWYSEFDPHNSFSQERSVNVTETGTYWVNAEVQAGGCYLEEEISVEFRIPEFTLGNDTVVCPGEDVTFTIAATNPDDEYLWQPGNITSSSYSVTPAPDEEINISLTMTDDLNCSATDEVTVTGYSEPVINWNITSEDVCRGDTIRTITDMAGYQWRIDGTIVPDHDEPYIIANNSGNYELTVWTNDNCAETQSLQLTVHDLPVINLSDIWACPGETGTFSLSGYDAYLWQNGATNASITMAQSDSVSVTVTDNNGCIASDNAYFGIYNEQIFSFGEDTSACENNDILIEVDDNFSNYEWTFLENGTSPVQTLPSTNHIYSIDNATSDNQGQYTVSAEDQNGCQVEDAFFLTIESIPDLTINEQASICEGDTIKIKTQNHKFISFEWTLDTDPTNILSDTSFVLVSDEGRYILDAWQGNGCTQTDTSDVSVWESPEFELDSQVISCPGTDVSIEMETWSSPQSGSAREPRNHTWSTGYPRAEYSTDESLTNPEAGVYYLTVEDNLCFYTDSVRIAYHELPEISLENAEACDNETFTLEIQADLQTSIKPSGSYFWSQDATSAEGAANSNWEVSEEGSYSLNITDNNGCENSENLWLTHLPTPRFSLGPDRDKCFGDTIMIEADPLFTRYEWNGDHSDRQANFIELSTSGTYSLEVFTANGCSSIAQTNIGLNPLPAVDLGPDITGCAGKTVTLTVANYPEIYWSNREKNVNSITAERGRHSVKVIDNI